MLLADGYEPAPRAAGEVLYDDGAGTRVIAERYDGVWVETRIARGEWAPGPLSGMWVGKRPIAEVGIPASGESPSRLVADGVPATWIDPDAGLQNPELRTPGVFSSLGDEVYLSLGEGEEPPAECSVSTFVSLGFGDGDLWYGRLYGLSGTGFVMLPGMEERFVLEHGGAGTLRLTLGAQRSLRDDDSPLGFEVRLDGETVARTECVPGSLPVLHDVAVELPDGPPGRVLELELEGRLAVAAVLEPRWMPAGFVDRARRPDVVVFLADTFRADNLSAYRGAPGGVDPPLAPNLDALSEECVVYRAAWSPSSWTLPSHASLFTSLWPTQHGAGWDGMQLAAAARTLAESVRAQGYRTLAITDGGFCSESLGLAQGFDVWFEATADLAESLDVFERFAAVDDGRARFVFVQTYRTHAPYVVTERSRAELAEHFAMPSDDLEARTAMGYAWADWKARGKPAEDRAELDARVADLAALYHGTVRDLDHAFAGWLAAFERHDLGDADDYLVFTSDHGEELGEHDNFGHATGVWDAQTRIPLLVRGPDLAPGVVQEPVSLVDLAPAIAKWLGLAQEPDWIGRPLGPGPSEAADVYLTARWLDSDGRQTGRIAAGFKSIVQPARGRAAIVDLTANPTEQGTPFVEFDPASGDRGWATQLGAPERILDTSPARVLDPESERPLNRRQLEHLRELGYGEMLDERGS